MCESNTIEGAQPSLHRNGPVEVNQFHAHAFQFDERELHFELIELEQLLYCGNVLDTRSS